MSGLAESGHNWPPVMIDPVNSRQMLAAATASLKDCL
jgi:hypothetical protein